MPVSFTCHFIWERSVLWPSDIPWTRSNSFRRPMHVPFACSSGSSTRSVSSRDSTKRKGQKGRNRKQPRKKSSLPACWTCSKMQLWFSAKNTNLKHRMNLINLDWSNTRSSSQTLKLTRCSDVTSKECPNNNLFYPSSLKSMIKASAFSNSSKTNNHLTTCVEASTSHFGQDRLSRQMV